MYMSTPWAPVLRAPLASERLSDRCSLGWTRSTGPGAGESYGPDRWRPIPPWDFKPAVRPRPSADPTVLEPSSRSPATRLPPPSLQQTKASPRFPSPDQEPQKPHRARRFGEIRGSVLLLGGVEELDSIRCAASSILSGIRGGFSGNDRFLDLRSRGEG